MSVYKFGKRKKIIS